MAVKTDANGEKLIKIRLPKERRDQEDVFVGVNERTWLIKRGVEVEIPECVAEVLRDREMMLETIMDFEDAKRASD
mgnify:FL=1